MRYLTPACFAVVIVTAAPMGAMPYPLEDGSSSPAFVMPLMMTADTSEGFGFLMELIPPEYAPFSDILNAR